MSKRSNACEFSQKEREAIIKRDKGECIFCNMMYRPEETDSYGRSIKEIMHYVPRSQGGLGVRYNAAVGCKCHHTMFDNGKYREEMDKLFAHYLAGKYKNWNKADIIYDKWRELKNVSNRPKLQEDH